jgi:molybdopterin converting factor small subunit
MAQMVLVNGRQAPRDGAARAAHRLRAGDTVAIFPPVAGGRA